ncbi:MAG TPA: anti-sigma factor antagonist [Gammaproteobacteria bacterium]|nr:anti-sigma factor antagonist [Gammaproteobacteria bacterium]
MSVSVQTSKQSGEVVIEIDGEFNFDKVMDFREAFSSIENVSSNLVVDLTACDYMDSAALGALLILKSQLGKGNLEITLRVRDSLVLKTLKAAHFERKFSIEEVG